MGSSYEYNKQYYKEHKEHIDELKRQWLEKNREVVSKRHREYYRKNKARELVRIKRNKEKVKINTLTHYGKGRLACVICGESRLACLSIDHINGGGNTHRRQLKLERERKISEKRSFSGWNFYVWLKKEGYPEGYQTLCMNCQFCKRVLDNSES